jgi:hypothetical protein
MPRQALALKKYRCGTSPVSKIADNEHTLASLGQAEELSVKHSVGDAIPEFDHAPENGSKVPSSVRRQDAGDVLPNQPPGPQSVSQPKIFEGQVTAVIIQASSEARDAEGLAGGSSDQKVNWVILASLNGGEVAVKRNVGIVVRQHGAREGLDLAESHRTPAKRRPRNCRGLDAATHAQVSHSPPPNIFLIASSPARCTAA